MFLKRPLFGCLSRGGIGFALPMVFQRSRGCGGGYICASTLVVCCHTRGGGAMSFALVVVSWRQCKARGGVEVHQSE
jgi:hypothetical protein